MQSGFYASIQQGMDIIRGKWHFLLFSIIIAGHDDHTMKIIIIIIIIGGGGGGGVSALC